MSEFDAVPRESGAKRDYIGCSFLGHPCDRRVWLGWKRCVPEKRGARTERILERGHHLEAWLMDTRISQMPSFSVVETQTEVSHGEIKGHLDAVLLCEKTGTSFLLEIKTMNDASFKSVKKKGVFHSHNVYYAQMQLYMHLKKLEHGLFLSLNKNTEEIYVEYIIYDQAYAEAMLDRGERIALYGDIMPEKLCGKSLTCKLCHYRDFCHPSDEQEGNKDAPERNLNEGEGG